MKLQAALWMLTRNWHFTIMMWQLLTSPCQGGTGLQLIKNLKQQNVDTGIIIISAKNSLDDKLAGLDLGADDYLTKPFHMAELNSRIKALLRRKKFNGTQEVVFNEIKINPENATVMIEKHPPGTYTKRI